DVDDLVVRDVVAITERLREELAKGQVVRHRVHREADALLLPVEQHLARANDARIRDRSEGLELIFGDDVLLLRVYLVRDPIAHVDARLTACRDEVLLSEGDLSLTANEDLHGSPR